jgi:hypothetical protein
MMLVFEMKNKTRSIAEKFAVYSQLGLFEQWKFRHFLRWISQDAVSLEFLLDFERKLVKKSLFSWKILKIMIKALSWYNREDHDNRLMNRIQPSRPLEMLQIVIHFLDKSYELHPKYRELLLNIIYSGDNFKKHHEVGSGLTPDQFRLEAAKTISNYNQQWGIWYPSIGSHRIRWEFDKFTEYIPYEMRSQDWTVDNEKTRPYWNSGEAAGLEFNRFVDALKPR